MNQVSVERTSHDARSMFSGSEIVELYDPIVKGMATYGGAMCDGYTAMSAEWLAFLNRRLHLDLSLAATLAYCRTPHEAMQEWSNFITASANDYRAEFERLAEISNTTSQQVVASLHNGRATSPGLLRQAP
ncbi:MAG: phasin family protein [Hyphomicrobium sp.]|jgi:hypothetical protein|nr:phasin family protein [Hyphomicrobium sp.]